MMTGLSMLLFIARSGRKDFDARIDVACCTIYSFPGIASLTASLEPDDRLRAGRMLL